MNKQNQIDNANQNQIDRLNRAKQDLKSALQEKGEIVSDDETLDQYSAHVKNLKVLEPPVSIENGGTGVSSMEGTDYSANRPRGIVLQSTVPETVPNGCIVGVYE